jgi:hypothetical protein
MLPLPPMLPLPLMLLLLLLLLLLPTLLPPTLLPSTLLPSTLLPSTLLSSTLLPSTVLRVQRSFLEAPRALVPVELSGPVASVRWVWALWLCSWLVRQCSQPSAAAELEGRTRISKTTMVGEAE